MKLTAYEHKMELRAWGIIKNSSIPLVAMKWFTMKQTGTHVLVAAIPASTSDNDVTCLMEDIQKAFRKVDVRRGEARSRENPGVKYTAIQMQVREPLTINVQCNVEEA
jgi:hypothetical protein